MDDNGDGGSVSPLTLPDGLAEKLIKTALEYKDGFWNKANRAGDHIIALQEEFSDPGKHPDGQLTLAHEVSAYIAYLDDKGTLKDSQETVLALANGTAPPEEYAKMFVAVNSDFNYVDTKASIALYLNNADLSKEDIATFVGAMCSSDGVKFLEGAIKDIDDPATKALVEFNYEYFKDHPSVVNVYHAGVSLQAPDLIDYANADLFKRTFENDPEGRDAFLKYLMQNDPESAQKLAENLGAPYLSGLYSEKTPSDNNSLYALSEKELLTPEFVMELLTGEKFPVEQPATPAVTTEVSAEKSEKENKEQENAANASPETTAQLNANVPDEGLNNGTDTDKVSTEAKVDEPTLTREDLEAMAPHYPLIKAFLERSGTDIPAEGFTMEQFTAEMNQYVNGKDQTYLGLSGSFDFAAEITADGNHLSDISLTEHSAESITQAAAATGLAETGHDAALAANESPSSGYAQIKNNQVAQI